MTCAICKKETKFLTVRESWLMAGGFGELPDKARVCPSCDQKEHRKLKAGKVKLDQIWTKVHEL